MSQENSYGKWREHIGPFLQSKLEEFHHFGLKRLTIDELWLFINESLAKRKEQNELSLNQFVNFVMSLSVNDYMNRIRMEMFKDADLTNIGHLFN
ncbi:ComN-like post-transcriptional regulator [Scopulibacillus darangshiensis]|uniref:ComN-like post-transcriptional regulator n=1 Tax=Scopulibacillus darangshiensis TaxID=442528 RepID=A0A4R2PCY5_9BACL|nr:post-transcriptional regulator [Scopulibacillus darangshiensis]TCP32264.1 ComN-like post-transcriptional regulator [Scopulibacillus darangshiensis]